MRSRAILWLMATPIVCALVLLYLILPGVLVSEGEGRSPTDRQLLDRVRQLQEFAESNVCRAPELGRPELMTPEQAEQNPDLTFRPLPADPETTPVPEAVEDTVGEQRNLADLIRDGTVLVVTESGIGSGFVVDDRHVVTNNHVVKGAERLRIINGALSEARPVEVIATITGNGVQKADLALLETEEALGLPALGIAPFPRELDWVFAAGYPHFVITTDLQFQRLVEGDMSAIPTTVITNGRINAIQNRDSDSPLLIHSAEISQGNSGGPIIDECGRVVGVNTFLRQDDKNPGARTVFYAQPGKRVLDGFADTQVQFKVIPGVCGAQDAGPSADSSPDEVADEPEPASGESAE